MESLLQGDRLQAEQSFIANTVKTLGGLKVKYGPDYSLPAASRPRKAAIAEVSTAHPSVTLCDG